MMGYSQVLLSFGDRINLLFDRLGFIIGLIFVLSILFVALSSALDVLDEKYATNINKFTLIYAPLIGTPSLFIVILLLRKALNIENIGLQVSAIFLIILLSTYYILISIKVKNNSNKKTKFIYQKIYRPSEVIKRLLIYLEIMAVVLVVLVPIVYIVGAALSPKYGIPTRIFPKAPTFKNFKTLFNDTNYLKWYWSTFQIALLTMVSSVLLSTTTAYIFSRFKFYGKKWGLIMLLVLQMFPSFMGLLALFTLYKLFNLIDRPLALVIIYAAGQIPYNTWLIKGYLSGIPRSLDESARIDGASGYKIFTKIIFPLAVPIITFVAVTTFMSPWMDYILASYLLIHDENNTLAVGLFDFINSREAQNYTMFAAGALLIAVPIGALYASLQRFLVEGITAGANKG